MSGTLRTGGQQATPYPSASVAPTISGLAKTASVLTCNPGAWNAGFGLTLSYQWLRDATAIGGATAATYTAVAADETHKLRCQVTATNIYGTRVALSPQSATVVP